MTSHALYFASFSPPAQANHMQINADGIAVIQSPDDLDRMALLLDRLSDALYGHLPRIVRIFLSRDALRAMLDLAATGLTTLAGKR